MREICLGCGVCPSGESSKADSTDAGAANVCCASAGTTLSCSGTCVNTLVDSNNCGSCGHVCPGTTPYCSSGSCIALCPTGSTLRGGVCVTNGTDNANCGACGNECFPPSYCSTSACALICSNQVYPTSGTIPDGVYEFLSSVNNGAVQDPNGGGSGTVLAQVTYTGSTYQKWSVTQVTPGHYRISPVANTGVALKSTNAWDWATVTTYTGAATQLFAFVQAGAYWNVVNWGNCLAFDWWNGGPGQEVGWFGYGASQHQTWSLIPR